MGHRRRLHMNVGALTAQAQGFGDAPQIVRTPEVNVLEVHVHRHHLPSTQRPLRNDRVSHTGAAQRLYLPDRVMGASATPPLGATSTGCVRSGALTSS